MIRWQVESDSAFSFKGKIYNPGEVFVADSKAVAPISGRLRAIAEVEVPKPAQATPAPATVPAGKAVAMGGSKIPAPSIMMTPSKEPPLPKESNDKE
jgi:hypothetical protein